MWAWSVQVTCGTCVAVTAWLQESRVDALTKPLCVAFLHCRLVVIVSVVYFLIFSQCNLYSGRLLMSALMLLPPCNKILSFER